MSKAKEPDAWNFPWALPGHVRDFTRVDTVQLMDRPNSKRLASAFSISRREMATSNIDQMEMCRDRASGHLFRELSKQYGPGQMFEAAISERVEEDHYNMATTITTTIDHREVYRDMPHQDFALTIEQAFWETLKTVLPKEFEVTKENLPVIADYLDGTTLGDLVRKASLQ